MEIVILAELIFIKLFKRNKMQGKKIKTKCVCPRCGGTGKARQFNRVEKYNDKVRQRAIVLFDKGLSLREIATKLKINHPQTIKNILSYK